MSVEWLTAWTGLATEIRVAADKYGYAGPVDLTVDFDPAFQHRAVRRAFNAVNVLLLIPKYRARHPAPELTLDLEQRVFDVAVRLADVELGTWGAIPGSMQVYLALASLFAAISQHKRGLQAGAAGGL